MYGVLCAHPVLRGALRLLRLRDLDRPEPPHRHLRRCVRRRSRAAASRRYPRCDERVLRRGHAVVDAGRSARADPRRDRSRRRRGSHRRMQPRQCRRGQARGVSPGRRQSAELRRAVDVGACARRARPHARSRQRRRARSRSLGDAGFERINVDLIYGTPGEIDRRLARHARRRDRARRLARQCVRADRRAGHAARESASPPVRAAPDDDVQADAYLLAETLLGAAGLEWYEVSNWARPGAGVPPQPLVLERRRSTSGSVAPRTATHLINANGAPPLVECAHARAVHRRDRRAEPRRSPGRSASTRSPAPRRRASLALRTRRGAPVAEAASGVVDELAAAGFVRRVEDRVVLTAHGRLVASDVTARLLLAGAVGTR